MHWFESQLRELDRLAEAYVLSQQKSQCNIVDVSEETRIKRNQFIGAVQRLVDKVSKIKGISACSAYHDGLILAHSAKADNVDGYGAMVQECIRAAQQGGAMLDLGNIEQIVIVGAVNKVALLTVGPLVLCISSSKQLNLALALSQGK